MVLRLLVLGLLLCASDASRADSVNSPNVSLNADTNRTGGAGAGNVSLAVNTITIAETMVGEYSAGAGKTITLRVRPGFQFDPAGVVTAQSATIGFNGAAANVAALLTPNGLADETLTFTLTSGTSGGQDIIRLNGIRVRILSAEGAAGPAQTTLQVTTSTAGGAFTNQGIVAASIVTGAPDHLVFATQPGTTAAGADILPIVKMVDFGGNLVTTSPRTISLALQSNPGAATLTGTAQHVTTNGTATWVDADDLHLNTAAVGYTLRASHDGASFLTSDTVDSGPFDVTALAGRLAISLQPADTPAGGNILVTVTALDNLDNPLLGTSVPVTLDLAVNPTDATLRATSSLTKNTTNGVAAWDATDALRITAAGTGYQLFASGIGAPARSILFDVTPAGANSVRYLQQPVETGQGARMDPPVRVEIIDAFGNRADVALPVEITLFEAPCGGTLSGSSATTSQGVATFPALTADTPCVGNVLKAASPRLGWAMSDPFTVTKAMPIALALAELRPKKLVHVRASGTFPLPDPSADSPITGGGSLTITGTRGSVTYDLPARGWKGLGPNRDGSKGFKFHGRGCTSVLVKATTIEAVCGRKTGDLALPEPGPVDVVLAVGADGRRYCGQCGGTAKGKAAKVFKHVTCDAPAACP